MAHKQEIHIGDIGTVLEVLIEDDGALVNVSSAIAATTKQIFLRKPDGTVATLEASFTTDGSDGLIRYVSLAATFDVVGLWKIQGRVVLTNGTWKSSIDEFPVGGNLA